MNLPNQLTLLRIFLTPVFVFLFFLDSTVLRMGSFVVFTVASLTDWYDGYAARKFGIVSMWGQFLDPLADKILVSSALICFSVIGYVPAWMILIIVVRDILITGLRSYAVIKGKPIATNFFAKVKTFSQFGVIYFVFIYHIIKSSRNENDTFWIVRKIQEVDLIFVLVYLVTIITVVSGVVYMIGNRSHLRQMVSAIYRIFVPSDV